MKNMKLEIQKTKTKRITQLTEYSKVIKRNINERNVAKKENSLLKRRVLNLFVIKNDVDVSNNGFPVLHSDNKNAFRNSFLVNENTPHKVKGNKKGNGICEWYKKHNIKQHKQNINQSMLFSFTKSIQSEYIDNNNSNNNNINNISINSEPIFKYSSNFKTPRFKTNNT